MYRDKLFTHALGSSTPILKKHSYRAYFVSYTMLDSIKYIIQIAFKLQDPTNSNLNKCEICVNGIKINGSWVNNNISNIANVQHINQPFWLGAERGYTSTIGYAKYKEARTALYKEFRTETQALIDAKKFGLA